MEAYKFNPLDYGFKDISLFPELHDRFSGNAFVKVTAVGGEMFNRLVYWFIVCNKTVPFDKRDDRYEFTGSTFDIDYTGTRPERQSTEYSGLISNHEFAINLFKHMFGTLSNDSVETVGKERLNEDLSDYVINYYKDV